MDEMTGPTPRRCIAHNRDGSPCGNYPRPGTTVCKMHGANAAQTRAAAQRKLLAGADFAIDYLVNMLEPRPPCPTCGRSDTDRDPVVVRAAQLVLDRAGFGPHATVTVNRGVDPTGLEDLSPDELVEELEEMLEHARRLAGHTTLRVVPPLVLDAAATVDTNDEGQDADGINPEGD